MAQMSLASARVNAKLTAEEACKYIGVSSVTLSSWENGMSFPSVKYLPRLFKLYKVGYEDINFFTDELLKKQFEEFANREQSN